MAQRILKVDGIGDVYLSKRRGAKNLRITINSVGKVRVSLPYWLPYAAGAKYVRDQRQWIQAKLKNHTPALLVDGSRIGKAHRVSYQRSVSTAAVSASVSHNSILIKASLPIGHQRVQASIRAASHQALKIEAANLLPQRLDSLARRHQLDYGQLKIKKLSSRWGSCSSRRDITLNYLLMELPWRLIDYVLLHELVHTRHLNHSREFWSLLERLMPDAQSRRREIKGWRPAILGSA